MTHELPQIVAEFYVFVFEGLMEGLDFSYGRWATLARHDVLHAQFFQRLGECALAMFFALRI